MCPPANLLIFHFRMQCPHLVTRISPNSASNGIPFSLPLLLCCSPRGGCSLDSDSRAPKCYKCTTPTTSKDGQVLCGAIMQLALSTRQPRSSPPPRTTSFPLLSTHIFALRRPGSTLRRRATPRSSAPPGASSLRGSLVPFDQLVHPPAERPDQLIQRPLVLPLKLHCCIRWHP